MEILVKISLVIHIAAGATALLVAPIAMVVKKGGRSHAFWGLTFFWSMTVIFITALFLSTVKWIPFLLMIAVFSYYSVFSAYRWRSLKKLHHGQQAAWYDWVAMTVNGVFNVAFFTWGVVLIIRGVSGPFPFLAIGFGIFGLLISKDNLQLFRRAHEPQTWLYQHMGGMLGGFIATLTAFSSQVMNFMPAWLQWSWPSVIGVPLISYWIARYRRKFRTSGSSING